MPDSALPPSAYATLEKRFKRLNALGEAGAILHWDLAAIMPQGGSEARAEQLAELAAVRHSMLTSTETAELISEADERAPALTDWQQANLREIKRTYEKATALTEDLVVALSKASSACETVWRDARPKADFEMVKPTLKALLTLVREEAQAKSEVLGLGLYDALLNDYEPGARSSEIDTVFAELEDFLPHFLSDVLDHQAKQPPIIQPDGPFPIETQKSLAEQLMTALGFDFDHGRLDVSLHPFCGGTPDDVRITTRYDETDFTSALMGVLHETGHALYERGLPKDWRGQPVGEALGMSIHESQSLLVEMQVCRSAAFLEWAQPLMKQAFGGDGAAWDVQNLSRLYTKVERGYIRVDADEVTYPAHVILRYKLEKPLIEGTMEVDDLPTAWDDGLEKLLGIRPPDNRLGCLQDIHWYDGAWGYFPTYTLGAMTAAQLYAAAKDQNSSIEAGVAKGDFAPLMTWLRDNVHGKGRYVDAKELLLQATGKPLDAEVFKGHLKARYLA